MLKIKNDLGGGSKSSKSTVKKPPQSTPKYPIYKSKSKKSKPISQMPGVIQGTLSKAKAPGSVASKPPAVSKVEKPPVAPVNTTESNDNYYKQILEQERVQREYQAKADREAQAEAQAKADAEEKARAEAEAKYKQGLLDYFKKQNEAAREASLNAVTARLKTGESQYANNLRDIGDQYQALRNQSEVERYKARGSLRESHANRGQLDSGYGRQENLMLDTRYGNAINSLNSQEVAARNNVQNIISQLRAEAEAEKSKINNEYNSKIEQYTNTLMGSK